MHRVFLLFLLLPGCSMFQSDPSKTGLFRVSDGECGITIADAQIAGGALSAGTLAAAGKVYVRRGECDDNDRAAALRAAQ